MDLSPGCALCKAIADANSDPEPTRLENTPLARSKHFVVLPSLGPLVLGHVLVVSRSHHPNLLSMGTNGLTAYEDFKRETSTRLSYYQDGLLEAEHGSLENKPAGACVVHTHIHWLPGQAHLASSIIGQLVSASPKSNAGNLPYFLLRAGNNWEQYQAQNLPAQYLRRRFCELKGRDDWDWAVVPRFDLIKSTIKLWHDHDGSL